MEITTGLFLTATGLALVVAIIIQALKLWLKPQKDIWWYPAVINTTAFVLGFVASLAGWFANRVPLDWPTVTFLALQGIVIGALSTGGYEWVANLIVFVGGARNGQAPQE